MKDLLSAYKQDLEWWEQNGTEHWNTSGAGTPCVDTDGAMQSYIQEVEVAIEKADELALMFRCLLRNCQHLTSNENAYDDSKGDSVSFADCEAMLSKLGVRS